MIDSLYPIFQKWSEKGSVYIVSDTHFEDTDCIKMSNQWVAPEVHVEFLKKHVHKCDTLIHLGDIGNPIYLDRLKCHKVLITGNHDVLSQVGSHFDEVYTGPLFIADRILLSHEPIMGLEGFCVNIHGHDHAGATRANHINLAANIYGFDKIFSLKDAIKGGMMSKIESYHRDTIDKATERKKKRK